MEILTTKKQVREYVEKTRNSKKKIGLVPTMGSFHHGHLFLMEKSMLDGCLTIVSIFVNPLQFGPSEDFQRYPRNIEKDISILNKTGINAVFMPSVEEMYSKNHLATIFLPNLAEKLEGSIRPGHFAGVCTVVAKLFNIVQPHNAYFGWKDAQQLIIIRKMVKDLDFGISIIGVPTVRDVDGLAASSRNIYLSESQRKQALVLSRALQKMKEMVEYNKIRDAKTLISLGRGIIEKENVELQYLEAVELENLEAVEKIGKNTGILGAIRIGDVRLIDNIVWI